MASTGEVACFGADVHEAFLKALISTNFKIPEKSIALTIPSDLLEDVVHHVWQLHAMGFELYATAETHDFLSYKGIPTKLVHYADSTQSPNIRELISNDQIDLVVNLPTASSTELRNNFLTRRTAVDFGVPLLTNAQLFTMFVDSIRKHKEGKIAFSHVSNDDIKRIIFDYLIYSFTVFVFYNITLQYSHELFVMVLNLI